MSPPPHLNPKTTSSSPSLVVLALAGFPSGGGFSLAITAVGEDMKRIRKRYAKKGMSLKIMVSKRLPATGVTVRTVRIYK